jgi:Oligosaccharyltransferase subunit Ribophorin II
LLGLLGLAIIGQALTPTTYFTSTDRERVRRIFLAASGDDLESIYYSVVGFNLLDGGVADAGVSIMVGLCALTGIVKIASKFLYVRP